MEDITPCPDAHWNDERYRQAATLLGQLAGSRPIQQLATSIQEISATDRLRSFVDSVGTLELIPGIMGEQLWQIPAVAESATQQVIHRLRALAVRAHALVDEIVSLPALASHGDASPQNLLPVSSENNPGQTPRFAVIDWGMFGMACAGFDLGQLLAGLANEGTIRGRELYRLGPLCLESYCEGLTASGSQTPISIVRRGHALSMALFTGLFAVASPRLGEPDSEDLRAHMSGRMEMAEFVLDLLAATD